MKEAAARKPSPASILVVDDDPNVLEVLESLLEQNDFDCRTASDAAQASETISQKGFDLILLDVKLPDQSGLELLGFISEQAPEAAVLMVSGLDDPSLVEAALTGGAYGYILKPFKSNEVLIQVQNALRRRQLEKENSEYRGRLEELVRERTEELESAITELREKEQELKQSEVRYRSLYENALEGFYRSTPGGCFLGVNPAMAEMLGYDSPQELIDSITDIKQQLYVDPADRDEFVHLLSTRGAIQGFEYQVLTKQGSSIWVVTNVRAVRDESGEIQYFEGSYVDVTERKEAEEKLRKAHREMAQLLAAISSILISLDASRTILQWNRAAESVFQRQADEVLGRDLAEAGLFKKNEPVAAAIEECASSLEAVHLADVRFRRQDGSDGFLGLTINPVLDESGALQGFLLLGADITEKRILESQLHQAQKLEAIGQLAAGIAHEINTPTQYLGDNIRFLGEVFTDLQKILDACSRLVEEQGTGAEDGERLKSLQEAVREADVDFLREEAPQAVEQSLEGVERVSSIVKSMKRFSHPGAQEKSPMDLNKAVQDTVTVTRNEWKYTAELETDLDPDLPDVPCFQGDVKQVLLNIIVNAAQAIKESVADGRLERGLIKVESKRAGRWAEVRIMDNGPGIPEAIRERIFDPFFTTKEVGQGTGQGLALAYNAVVEKHDGELYCESEVGRGTTFVLKLPVSV